jgi:hypothetical protein
MIFIFKKNYKKGMKKQIFFWMLLLALIYSLGWKLNDSSARMGDGLPSLLLIGVIFIVIFMAVRRILREG